MGRDSTSTRLRASAAAFAVVAVTAPVVASAGAPGIIDTVAGSPGLGPARSVGLAPFAIAAHNGHIYIADDQWGVVRDVDLATHAETVIAGDGTHASTGDGGRATQAALKEPEGVAVDSAGNIYVSDSFSARVRRIDAATGLITTIAGIGATGYSGDGGPALQAKLTQPAGLAVDAHDNLYIADTGNSTVRRVDAKSGIITTVAGTGSAGYGGDGGPGPAAQVWSPLSVAVDHAGNVVIADAFNNRVREVDASTGIITTIAGTGAQGFTGDGGSATSAELDIPFGVAVEGDDSIDISDQGNVRIRQIAGAVSSDGTHHIGTIAGSGTQGFSGDGGPATAADFGSPYGIAVDAQGTLWVGDYYNYRLRAVAQSTSGRTIDTVAGNGQLYYSGDGGDALKAELSIPWSVAVGPHGDLYVVDAGTSTVRKVEATLSADGTHHISTVAGNANSGSPASAGGPATSVVLDSPSGIALDPAGNMYIAMTSGNEITRVDAATGMISVYAGNGAAGALGDSGPAQLAELDEPKGIALDAAGDLFIADSCNAEIREVSASTVMGEHIITTVAGHIPPPQPPKLLGPMPHSTPCPSGYGGDGGAATSASLNDPEGVAVAPDGSMDIADSGNSRVRHVDAHGTITSIAGDGNFAYSGDGGHAAAAELSFPLALVHDASGNLLIDDSGNGRIREIAAGTNVITTIAGNGSDGTTTPFYSGDGGPALAAAIAAPQGMALDSAGNLYIAAPFTRRLREVYASTAPPSNTPDLPFAAPAVLMIVLLAGFIGRGVVLRSHEQGSSGLARS